MLELAHCPTSPAASSAGDSAVRPFAFSQVALMDWKQQWRDVNPQRREDALGEQVERCLQQGEHLTAGQV